MWCSERDCGQPKSAYPSLRGHHTSDVVIVGGGITGALIAEAFAAEDISVSVLERGSVGCGSTVASAALLLQEPDNGLAQLSRRYGRAGSASASGGSATRPSAISVRQLAAQSHRLRPRRTGRRVIRDHGRTPSGGCELSTSSRLWAGFEGEWLTAAALGHLTGVPGRGAIRTRGNAQFDPYRACVGIMHAAASRGGQCIQTIRRDADHPRRDGVRVHTRDGRVDASRVVIATGYATRHFRPLAGQFRMYHTYVLATPPLSAAERHRVGYGDLMIWDTERPYHYARWTPEHRLLLGGADRPVRRGRTRNAQFATATRELRAELRDDSSSAGRHRRRAHVGGSLRHHARQPAVHRSAPAISEASVCARLWRQRHDVRLPCRPSAA